MVAAPFLVACYLALALVGPGANAASRQSDLWGSLVLFLLSALCCWWASRVVGDERGKRVLAAVVLVIWFSMLGTARLLLAERSTSLGLSPHAFFTETVKSTRGNSTGGFTPALGSNSKSTPDCRTRFSQSLGIRDQIYRVRDPFRRRRT